MPQFDEAVVHADEDTPVGAPIRQLAGEWPQFRVACDKWMHCPDYGARAHEILFVTEQVPDLSHQSKWIEDVVRIIGNKISTDEVSEEDVIGVSLTAWGLEEKHRVVVMGMRQKKLISLSALKSTFEGIKRDRPTFLSNGPLVIKVKHVRLNTQQPIWDIREFRQRCLKKKSIITAGSTPLHVENLSRALALSKAYLQRRNSTRLSKIYKRLKGSNSIHLQVEAMALRRMAGASVANIGLALHRFDRYYTNKFTLTVFLGLDGKSVLYESWAPPKPGRPYMDVVTDGRDFHVVTSIGAAFSSGQKRLYCRHCRVHYRYESEHQCLECCSHCRKVGVCLPGQHKHCNACKRDFVNDSCFKRHLYVNRAGKSTCDLLQMCTLCREEYSVEGRARGHICDRRQSNQAVATVAVRRSARPRCVGGSTGNSDNAKRPRLDVDSPVLAAAKNIALFIASTSREPADERNTFGSETADMPEKYTSRPATKSPAIPTVAQARGSPLCTERSVGSAQNPSAGPSPGAGNLPPGREAVRGGRQTGGSGAAADLPKEAGPTPPHPVRALHYTDERKVVVYY
ncbi:uncharacterized protein LOC126339291 [Schistocerca gregaria]|uniref:uncharacterized protein LOC126339291 n=1 Tax=Schistocerca gregaria TaxID=7010 RepID=UPI00211EA716|nr:uncharacterized protein LOC126339291 [Schistocerca gregaria]